MKQQSTNPISYLFRHIGFFMLLGFLPACLLAICDNSQYMAVFWIDYFTGAISKSDFFSYYITSHIYLNTTQHWVYAIIYALAGVALTISWSVMVFRTDRHMQLGILIKQGLLGKSMSISLRVAVFFVLVFVFNELSLLLIVGVIYLLSMFISYGVVAPVILVLTLLQKVLLFTLIFVYSVSLPIVVSENYPLNIAMGYASRLSINRKYKAQAVLVVLLSMLMFLLSMLIRLSNMYNILGTILIGLMMYMWIIMMPIVACDRYVTDIGAQRKDVKTIF